MITLYKETGDSKMKKRVCLFGIVIGIMCSLLCGCSNSENDHNDRSDITAITASSSPASTSSSSPESLISSLPENTVSSSAENSIIGADEYYSEHAEVISVTKAKE